MLRIGPQHVADWPPAAHPLGRVAEGAHRGRGLFGGADHGHDDAGRRQVDDALDEDRVVPADADQGRHLGGARRQQVGEHGGQIEVGVLGLDPEEVAARLGSRLGNERIGQGDLGADHGPALGHGLPEALDMVDGPGHGSHLPLRGWTRSCSGMESRTPAARWEAYTPWTISTV